MRRLFAATVVLLVGLAADAATFRLEFDGARIAGGEICIFDAISVEGPVERLTTFSTVTCKPADGDVPLPKGTWNLFARQKDGYTSRQLLHVRDGRVDDDRRVIELVKAGRLQFEWNAAKADTAAVYVEETGAVLPLVPGESAILAPRSTTVVPLFMSDRVISRIGPQLVVESAGASVRRPAPTAERVDFCVGLVPDLEAFKQIPPHGRAPGRIELVPGDGPPVLAMNRVDPAFKGTEAIALFRQVPVAAAVAGSVRVAGQGWSSDAVKLKSLRVERSLRIAPTTTLTVHWSTADDLARLAEQVSHAPACPRGASSLRRAADVPGSPESGLTLTLARCPGLQLATAARSVRKSACTRVASATLDANKMAGSESINDVAPGVYLLRLSYEKLPPAFETIEVARADAASHIELRYDRWFGKVTRDREPLHAQVGIGDGAVSDPDTGEYFTVSTPVPPPPPDVAARLFKDPPPIAVVGCTSDFASMFVPEESPIPNTRFDIEIVPNKVTVRVIDVKTGGPIQGAAIDYSALRRDDPDIALFSGNAGTTDDNGQFTLSDIPANREILVCASHEQYRHACADRFLLKAMRERQVTIQLEAANLRKGRIDNPATGGGRVQWYRPDGRALESASIAMDGTFTYKDAHAPGEIVSVISPGAPLLVLRQPYLDDKETFEISYPAAPVRTFSVVLPRDAKEMKGFFSLSVGDIVVPLAVLSNHLRSRGSRPLFLSPGAVTVPDIVASGPISFIFAPISWAEIYARDQSIDTFYAPAAAALPRVPAGASASVIIGR